MVSRSILLFAGLLIAIAAGSAGAAQSTWADPAGVCAGNSPCFTSVSDALANAGPAPAQVFVFPGTYVERVILGTMGSAIGETPGDLSVVSVDAAGRPAPGAVIDSRLPAGPGGSAIAAAAFPGTLVIDGLVLRSSASHALHLHSGTESVLLSRITVTSNLVFGAAVSTSGGIRVEGSTAAGNGLHGFVLQAVPGTVEIDSCLAVNNGDNGFSVRASTISVVGSRAEGNSSNGFLLLPRGTGATALVEDVEAISNAGPGLLISQVFGGDNFAVVSLRGVTATSNASTGMRVNTSGAVTATDVTATDSGEAGVQLAAGSAELSRVVTTGNGGVGMILDDPAPGSGSPQRITVLLSRIEDNAEGSVELTPGSESEVRIACSDLVGNGPTGMALITDITVDARSSFWGAASGPLHPGNPGGTGDPVHDAATGLAGTVLYAPFLVEPAGAADCPIQSALEIPALDPSGLAVLALLLAGAALALLRRRSPLV